MSCLQLRNEEKCSSSLCVVEINSQFQNQEVKLFLCNIVFVLLSFFVFFFIVLPTPHHITHAD